MVELTCVLGASGSVVANITREPAETGHRRAMAAVDAVAALYRDACGWGEVREITEARNARRDDLWPTVQHRAELETHRERFRVTPACRLC